MPTNMIDEINTDTTGPLVMQVSHQSQWTKMAFKFPAQQRRGLAAAGVTCLVAAQKNEIIVWARRDVEG